MPILGPSGAPLLPSYAEKAAVEATGELLEKLNTLKGQLDQTLSKAMLSRSSDGDDRETGRAKGWFQDPFSLLDSAGVGYRANPTSVTYETLRQMTERDTLLGSIINTRISQVSSFCREQENPYSIGFKVRPRNKDARNRRLRPDEKARVTRIERFMDNMGAEENITRDTFVPFMKKVVRDRLTFDQVNFEKVATRGGGLYEILAHDPATIRLVQPKDPKGRPLPPHTHQREDLYVQLMNGEPLKEFTPKEMAFAVANPRSSIRANGYGFPEPQLLIMTVTAHLWAEEWNRKAFSQGSTIKGVLNLKGNISRQNYETFKRQWGAQVGGVNNAWRTPILNSEGVEFTPMQLSNTEMGYQMWIEYLIKIACAIYQMDPTEINFDLRGSQGQQPVFMGNNEAQQKMSKDRGLRPLLNFFQDTLNRHVVYQVDDQYELVFVGLDAKTEEASIELRTKQGSTMLTINELRALEDLPPLKKGGDIIMNPAYTGYLQQEAMAQQQQGQGGAQPGGEQEESQPPQMPGQDEQMQQPYAGRLGAAGDKPTAGAKLAAGRLEAKHAANEEPDEPGYYAQMRENDWQDSIHAALGEPDLKKSIAADTTFYIDVDL